MSRIGPALHRLGPILVLLAIGCVIPTHVPISEGAPRQHRILGVPFFSQVRSQCGPAALAMALSYAGTWTEPDAISEQVFTEARGGSFQFDVVGAARRRAHVPFPIQDWDHLLDEVVADRPVVVLQNLGLFWYPVWHFAVLIGFDLDASSVTLHSGRERARTIALATFARTWRRGSNWGRVILPPGELPTRISVEAALDAIQSFERTEQWEAAARSYIAVTERWPGSAPAQFALGNALYRAGDSRSSAAAFEAALRIEPSFMPALNNLAHVLAESGEKARALELLEVHRDRPGPWRDSILRTLEQIAEPDTADP